jgi:hypothetical protein
VFTELVFFGEQLQALALGFLTWIENKMAVANENRSCDLALNWNYETHRSGVQMEGAGVAFQIEVTDRNGLGSEG